MKKWDMALLAGLLLLAGLSFWLLHARRLEADRVIIKQDGKNVGVYSLAEQAEIVLDNQWGKNIIQIKDGQASVTEANCPDQYCVRHRPISGSREVIICLPHKLVIEVESAKGEGVDMLAD